MKIIKALKLLLKYRAASKRVDEIETELRELYQVREWERRLLNIPQWSNACVKRNKLEKQLLKAFLDI